MKKRAATYLLFSISVISMLFVFNSCRSSHRGSEVEEQKDTILPLGFLTDTLEMVESKVRDGECFSSMCSRLGVEPQRNHELVQACEEVFDVRKLRAGNTVRAYYTRDSMDRRLQYIVYVNSRTTSTVFRTFDSLAVWKAELPVHDERKVVDVTINTSLWNDMQASGASILAILKLSDIYAWTVDFFGLQKGDRFRVIYNQQVCENEVIDVDTVYFAIYTSDGKDYPVIMYDQGDGGNVYWNEKGESMKKAFLKAPLHYSRISSGFSTHRLHPVTRKVQPHLAVDYAAPSGTPVMAIGDGTVLSAGYSGAAGNMVKIRHNSVYQTAYLHLSKYAPGIKAGTHVSQGQVIGYVGSTGRSTGPHLDFRVWKNGTPVNPLKLESPSMEPIRAENLPALDSLRNYWMQQF